MVVQAISLVALLLLAASGVAKAVDPEPTTRAMKAARLPAHHTLTRLLGMIEIAAGAAAVAGTRGPLLGGILYLGFGLFTLLALRGAFAIESCGCFGREDTPPSVIHVIYNFAAAGSLLLLSASKTPLLPSVGAPEAALYLGFGLLGAYLSYLLLTRLPQTLALARDGS